MILPEALVTGRCECFFGFGISNEDFFWVTDFGRVFLGLIKSMRTSGFLIFSHTIIELVEIIYCKLKKERRKHKLAAFSCRLNTNKEPVLVMFWSQLFKEWIILSTGYKP